MSTIVTRSGKGSSLTWAEGDANFTNLNNDKLESTSIGTTVQAYSPNLDEYAAVNPTTAGLALLDDANSDAQLTTLGGTVRGVTLFKATSDAEAQQAINVEVGVDVLAYAASASQAEMEAGTEAGLRIMSPLRVAQAISTLGSSLVGVTAFTSNGTWTKTTGTKVIAMAVGGGGGGGAGDSGSSGYGGAGGKAGCVNWAYTSSPAATYAVTIGAGGGSNTAGSSTTVGALLTALGGKQGKSDCLVNINGDNGDSCLGLGGAGGASLVGGSASANTGAGGGGGGSGAGGSGGSGYALIWEFK